MQFIITQSGELTTSRAIHPTLKRSVRCGASRCEANLTNVKLHLIPISIQNLSNRISLITLKNQH
ncbi:hypothetical protein [Lyngbya sp. PCC 8106]|uniref:hypothetical protein n=1 Tax=Lyngbya sp. (strain PCC 8106) TaxID=313612 RepID=UPI0000EA8F67|nr:hypothetical protein [Lyngbya sp. PCC 8106]EAW35111.1 hypothetical protein L8106_27534 [Lyngbya sp. PCC 8106]